MKTQAECWQAILDGKTLTSKRGIKTKLAEDGRARVNGNMHEVAYCFTSPDNWSIYEKPEGCCRFKKKVN